MEFKIQRTNRPFPSTYQAVTFTNTNGPIARAMTIRERWVTVTSSFRRMFYKACMATVFGTIDSISAHYPHPPQESRSLDFTKRDTGPGSPICPGRSHLSVTIQVTQRAFSRNTSVGGNTAGKKSSLQERKRQRQNISICPRFKRVRGPTKSINISPSV